LKGGSEQHGHAALRNIIDCNDGKNAASKYAGYRCFVDGVEIQKVYYVDTEAGIVKTYDVMGDGRSRHVSECGKTIPSIEVLRSSGVYVVNGRLHKLIRGSVEMRPSAPLASL